MASNFQHLSSTERDFSSFIQSCKSVLAEVSAITSATVPDIQCTALDHLEVLEIRLYEVYLSFGVIAENLEEGSDGHCKVVNLKCLFSDIHEFIKSLMNTVTADGINQGYAAGSINTGRRGRPKKDVLRAQITYLKSKHFKKKSTAKLLGIHPKTLRRRIQEMGLEENEYSDLSKN